MTSAAKIGVIAIGRNEGERLKRSLSSVARWARVPKGARADSFPGSSACTIVYVDSGSTDGSLEFARSLGVEVVELDTTIPFTAGRARAEGFQRLLALAPELEYVQFIDGDCEVVAGWIDLARARLEGNAALGVVCGRRRERFPETTIWNRLCDLEWNTPVGLARACGGDALFRVAAYRAAGGFDERLVAGEEPELCVRIRVAGFTIERLDAEMTLHDAAMTRFSQWWRRASRNGHAIVGGMHKHGVAGMHDYGRQLFRAVFWCAAIAAALLVALAGVLALNGLAWKLACAALPLAVWAYVLLRTYASRIRRGDPARHAALYAFFVVLGKLPEVLGAWASWRDLRSGRRSRWIEYKPAPLRIERGEGS